MYCAHYWMLWPVPGNVQAQIASMGRDEPQLFDKSSNRLAALPPVMKFRSAILAPWWPNHKIRKLRNEVNLYITITYLQTAGARQE